MNLSKNDIGEKKETVKCFEDFMKKLPSNLQNLELNISYNYIADNKEKL